jgi:hypothetical protein
VRRLAVVLLAGLVCVSPAWALDTRPYRYERPLKVPVTDKPIWFVPDRELYGHAQIGFGDLRILDSAGHQVPWRALPQPRSPRPVAVSVINAGRQGNAAVALLDLGRRRRLRDRLELDVPDTGFVARVEVLGTDDRRTFTHLSTSVIYDVEGAEGSARSTVVSFPPSDFRYLQLRARGVSRIAGATVSGRAPSPNALGQRTGPSVSTEGRTTRVELDLDYPKVPVDALDVSARTPRYDRPVSIEGSNDGELWQPLASARVYRFRDSVASGLDRVPTTRIRIEGRHRYLRLSIDNGDDRPLRGIDVQPLAYSRPLLAAGGHPRPLRAIYGDPLARPPVYDFARLPVPKPTRFALGSVGLERRNQLFEPAPDTRSFAARHSSVVTVALVLAAMAAAAAGALALRRRA